MIVCARMMDIMNQLPFNNSAKLAIHRVNLAADQHPKIAYRAIPTLPQ
jgi:hypothetical protein